MVQKIEGARRNFTADEVRQMFGPKPWHDTAAMDEMQRGYLEELPERWPDAEYPEHCAIAFMDGMRRYRAAIAPFIHDGPSERVYLESQVRAIAMAAISMIRSAATTGIHVGQACGYIGKACLDAGIVLDPAEPKPL